jgi:hypothetical protein
MTKRSLVFFLLSCFAPFVFEPVSFSDVLRGQIFLFDGLQTIQLTNSYENLSDPLLTDSGHILWMRKPQGAYSELVLYDGANATTITETYSSVTWFKALNNSGEAVWPSRGSIHFYDGTSTIELPYPSCYWNSGQRPCDINNNGHVVWMGRMSEDSECEVFLYDRTQVIQLSDTDYYAENPAINDNGQVVWNEDHGYSDAEIFFYDGTSVSQLTDDSYANLYPELNESGEIVWLQYDGSLRALFFYDGTTTTRIADSSGPFRSYRINDNGNIVWSQEDDDGDQEIFLYDGTTTIQLTANDFRDDQPQINNSGQVVWQGQTATSTDTEVYLYDGQNVIQLTANLYGDGEAQINSHGHVIWCGEVMLPNLPWSAASTMNAGDETSSISVNYLLLIGLPIAVFFLYRGKKR